MRANIPTDNGDDVIRPVVDDVPAVNKLTNEQLQLAKVGNSADWKLITDYLESRIEIYKNGLFGEDLKGKDAAIVGQRFLAAQSVVAEFQSLIDQIETTTKIVKEAVSDSHATARPE